MGAKDQDIKERLEVAKRKHDASLEGDVGNQTPETLEEVGTPGKPTPNEDWMWQRGMRSYPLSGNIWRKSCHTL